MADISPRRVEWRSALAVKILRWLGWVVGASLIVLGTARILFPSGTIPGAAAMTASLDTEIRTGGVFLIAFGSAYLWAVRQPTIAAVPLRILAVIMALLAGVRAISFVESGPPHWAFIMSAAVELLAALLTWWYSTMGHPDYPRRAASPSG
ncbi:hypothetical protein A5731_30125 [Mycolicibacterium conceptionense]|uniref:DUF4345 domain-containing protein n=1 Tax=Mycolicibacterium conceptionense TaxID=451644 RepID=A0A1A0PH00_9MYCO|nr:hypothetical protein A5718_13875 [Mycolicibacterium conceptionense]OBE92205.1 hypothetical protein A5731_30125 [Mycolicibacterium conceptionense]OBF24695.1 hypothetical protein A5726_08685 [Mycolicibacterium conceptionense]OBF45110.1 hypothetical protein A5720_09195 [Mycolicibacterium conceptionense]OBI02111.1 hypothetical protein A5716_02770 [Mycolicibacterium conceptionense]